MVESSWTVACPACRKELRFHTQSAGAGAGLMNCACGACGAIFRMRAPPAGQASGSRNGTAASVSSEAIVSESQVVLAVVACLLLLTGLMQRMLMVLIVAGLCAAYTFNPIHDSHMMSEGWEALRARRQAILDARDKKDLKKWKARHGPVIELTKPASILKVLKNAVVDTLQQWQGQRVAVNFAFFTLAYIDSEAAVDGDLCAVGALGGWMVLELNALRTFARSHLEELLRGEPAAVS